MQAEAAGALFVRDRDRSLVSFFGGSRVGGIALEQDLAAEAMHEGEMAALFDLNSESQRFIDASQRPFRVEGLGLELRQKRVEERRVEHVALIRKARQRLPKFCGAGRGVMETAPRPSRKQFGID